MYSRGVAVGTDLVREFPRPPLGDYQRYAGEQMELDFREEFKTV